jgi:hypothetical protein
VLFARVITVNGQSGVCAICWSYYGWWTVLRVGVSMWLLARRVGSTCVVPIIEECGGLRVPISEECGGLRVPIIEECGGLRVPIIEKSVGGLRVPISEESVGDLMVPIS